MSDSQNPTNQGREPKPNKVKPSGYFRGADPSQQTPKQNVEQNVERREVEQLPAGERGEVARTLHDADAVRDDPHAQIIPHGEPSGTTAALYETSDVGMKILAVAGAIVFGLVIVALIAVFALTRVFYSSPRMQPQGGSPVETAVPPEAVELRANPLPAWERYQTAAERRLNSYGWVVEEAGVAHIPIDRAMTLLLEGVKPVTGQDAPAATPTPDGS